MTAYLGEIAALVTALMFTASSTFFGLASPLIGSVTLNRLRLVLATGWLLLAHLLLRTPIPLHVETSRLFWLTISGVLGLVIGDMFLFQAFIWIGPRLTMLMMALSPALAALLAWLITGEVLTTLQLTGIALTLLGILWVIAEKGRSTNDRPAVDSSTLTPEQAARLKQRYILGILCGLGAAAGQASGLVTARLGLAGGFPAVSGTLIRMVTAMVGIWLITLVSGQVGSTLRSLRSQPRALGLSLGGAFFGPFMGVTLSLYAVQHTEIGIASTLNSLTPIFLLPVGYLLFKERFGWQAIAGTILAMAGVALLF